jgi:DNA-binding transcriptional ArsR family regulator
MDIFLALADPTRRNILEIIAEGGRLAASDIAAHFKISAPAISQHLKVLKESKLVVMEKQAQQRIYQINPAALYEIEDWTKKMNEMLENRFSIMDKLIEAEKRKAIKS